MIFFNLDQFIFLFLSSESFILVVQLVKAQFSNPLSTNSLFWAFWAWVHLSFGLRCCKSGPYNWRLLWGIL